MQITVSREEGGVFPLLVSAELALRDLRALLEAEMGVAGVDMLLVHNMAPMTVEDRALGDYGVQEGDVIVVSRLEEEEEASGQPAAPQTTPPAQLPLINWGSIPLPSPGTAVPAPPPPRQEQAPPDPNDPTVIRRHFLSHPYELALLRQRNPLVAEAVTSGDAHRLREVLAEQQRYASEVQRQRIRMLAASPMDPEAQQRIAANIQQHNIEENREAALEHTPEIFTNVVMLYIDCKVNGVHVRALVDSGARSTVMSQRCAKRCNIMRLVDRRYAGIAFGVGRQKIVGRVHLGQFQIGRDFLTSSFQVLEEAAEDMLLGLDMLRRHLVRGRGTFSSSSLLASIPPSSLPPPPSLLLTPFLLLLLPPSSSLPSSLILVLLLPLPLLLLLLLLLLLPSLLLSLLLCLVLH